MSVPVTGSCLCGGVRYALDRELPPALACHCRFCRRAHGAPFVLVSAIPRDALRFTRGGELVRTYETEGGGLRSFCERCGTRLFNSPRSFPGLISVVVGTLDEEPTAGPVAHLNVESKAPWFEIRDGRPQHDALPEAARRMLDREPAPDPEGEDA